MTDSNTVAAMNGTANGDSGMPRGVIAVVVVGLIACVAAALLATDKGGGTAADLEWVMEKPIAGSATAEVPGGGGEIKLGEGSIKATGVNASGYELYRALSVLKIDAGAPVGSARIECTMFAPAGTEVAQTPGSRASYPRSSDELFKQEVPEVVLVEFSSHGDELATVETDDLPEHWATERGIKLEWPDYVVRKEGWKWFLPAEKPKQELVLPFFSVWKTTKLPEAKISCDLTTSAGTATVTTKGALSQRSPAIAE